MNDDTTQHKTRHAGEANGLVGRTVLVTGGNRGLGRHLVHEALARGAAQVVTAGRRPPDGKNARTSHIHLDLADHATLGEGLATVVTEIDVLINNAGISLPDRLGASLLREHLLVNLEGPMRVTETLLPGLRSRHGAVVNVLSLAALSPIPGLPGYSMAKAAAHAWTQSLRAEERGRVHVHAVLAGPIDTDMIRDLPIPKSDPSGVAAAIFDGVLAGHEDIFPDAMSTNFEAGWQHGPAKSLEQQNAALLAS